MEPKAHEKIACPIQCGPVSKLFSVSSRVIRDIWNRKTWANATKQLWSLESTSSEVSRNLVNDPLDLNFPETRRVGRPKGSLDTKPRLKKATTAARVNGSSAIRYLEQEKEYRLADSIPFPRIEKHIRPQQSKPQSFVFQSSFPNDQALSWTDVLKFSRELDPFHDDWPHW